MRSIVETQQFLELFNYIKESLRENEKGKVHFTKKQLKVLIYFCIELTERIEFKTFLPKCS